MIGTIVRLAGRGDGVTADGRFVPLTAPGDEIGPDGAVIPGPHHAVPPCCHYPTCGGCQLQHIDDAAYADFVVARIADALHSQRLDLPEIRTPYLSPPRTRRRASLKAERTGRTVRIGFSEARSHRIVDMRECHVLAPALFDLVAPLRALLLPMIAERRQAEITMTATDQGIDLGLSGVSIEGLDAIERLTGFAQLHGLARVTVDEGYGPEARWAPDEPTVTLGGVAVPFPPGGFLQATADGEAAILRAVEEAIGAAATVADLFAGLGTFALPLSARAKVYAAEGARDALLMLKGAAARAGRPVFAEHRDLFRRPLSAAELSRFDAVVIDPPRAGAREQAEGLAGAELAAIAYVSCNPATFARDAARLVEGGWRMRWIQPVGQFRWSTHVELIAAFTR